MVILTSVAGIMTFFPLKYLTPLLMNTLNTILGGNSAPVNLLYDKNHQHHYVSLKHINFTLNKAYEGWVYGIVSIIHTCTWVYTYTNIYTLLNKSRTGT